MNHEISCLFEGKCNAAETQHTRSIVQESIDQMMHANGKGHLGNQKERKRNKRKEFQGSCLRACSWFIQIDAILFHLLHFFPPWKVRSKAETIIKRVAWKIGQGLCHFRSDEIPV